MMCNTAAIQVNVGLGEPDQVAARWRLANQLGPTLIACFANSPFAGGLPSGWQSSRLRAWWALDPTRSAPVPLRRRSVVGLGAVRARRPRHAHPSRRRPLPPDERAAELRRLAPRRPRARVADRGRPAATTSRRCSRRCARRAGSSSACSTRCPRPCGRWRWPSPCAALTDVALAPALDEAVAPTADLWVDAAQLGLAHPDLARSGVALFDLALAAMRRAAVSIPTASSSSSATPIAGCAEGVPRATTDSTTGATTATCSLPPRRARSTLATSERSA